MNPSELPPVETVIAPPRAQCTAEQILEAHLQDHLREDPRMEATLVQLQNQVASLRDEVEQWRHATERGKRLIVPTAGLLLLLFVGQFGFLMWQHTREAANYQHDQGLQYYALVQSTSGPSRSTYLQQAKEHFQAAAALEQGNPEHHFSLAVVLMEMNQTQLARRELLRTTANCSHQHRSLRERAEKLLKILK